MQQPHNEDPGHIEGLKESHTPEVIRKRLAAPAEHSYLRDFVYGAIDGTVTTFAVVSGVAGAGLSTGVIIVLGVANLVADGFSMAASNYLGTKTEEELRQRARKIEEMQIENYPEGEREEIRQIFSAKGFQGTQLEEAVDVITADRRRWVDTMLVEELRLTLEGPSAIKAASTTLVAFVIVGLIPLLAFLLQYFMPLQVANPYPWSMGLTATAFFLVGAAKSWFVDQSWYRSGIETLLIGGGAAALAFVIGKVLGGVAA